MLCLCVSFYTNDMINIVFYFFVIDIIMFCCIFPAKLLLKLKRMGEAATVYRELLDRNPENSEYYKGLQQAINPGR